MGRSKTGHGADPIEPEVHAAPLAGISDIPFRALALRHGADLVHTEMISAKGLINGNPRTLELLRTGTSEESSLIIQLFGANPEELAEAVEEAIRHGRPRGVDLNMGCPVPKVVKSGAGAALMRVPQRAAALVQAVRDRMERLGLDACLSVKMRSGWDDDEINAPYVASLVERAGAQRVTVHARTRSQFYSGDSDWSVIARVKDRVSIPVIGNGDIACGEDAGRMIQQTGCDGIMVGRASLGNPWVFAQIKAMLRGQPSPPAPDERTRLTTALQHLDMLAASKGEDRAVLEMRKHLTWYSRGMPFSAAFRRRANETGNLRDLRGLLISYREIVVPQASDCLHRPEEY